MHHFMSTTFEGKIALRKLFRVLFSSVDFAARSQKMIFDSCHRFVEKQVGGEKEVVNSSSTSSQFVDSYPNEDTSCANESNPVAINRKTNCSGDSIGKISVRGHIHLPSGSMSPQRSQTITTSTRPTKDKASALWEIMSTPPANYALPWNDSNDSERVYTRDFVRIRCLPTSLRMNCLHVDLHYLIP